MSHLIARLNPGSLPNAGIVGYSQITVAAPRRLAFISGQVAWRVDGSPAPASLAEQTTIVLDNARAALEAIGATPHDILMIRIYVVDMTPERTAEAMPLVIAFLDGAQPSLTGVGVVALASPELQIEMELVVGLSTG